MFLVGVAQAASEAVSEAAVEAGGVASLGLNGWQFLAQLVNFGLLIFILRKFLYKPLVGFMTERSNKIAAGLTHAEQYSQKLKDLEIEAKNVIAQAEATGREKIAEASASADRIVGEAQERAKNYEESSRTKMAKVAEEYRQSALEEVRQQAGELVVMATAKVLQGVVTKEIDAKIVDKALKEVKL